MESADVAAWQARIVEAGVRGERLAIRGGGSKDFLGVSAPLPVLDARSHAGIIAYEPSELVITARAGTRLAEINAALAARGQHLAFEPPEFGDGTLGGAIASGLSGPARMSAGAVRDFVLGVRLLDGRGRLLRFGGQVMKNVAGFDVSRLLCGSFGSLGMLLEVSLKVLPRPMADLSLHFECDQAQATRQVNAWIGQALPITASCWYRGALTVRLSGAHAAVAAARQTLGGEVLEATAATAFWSALRDQRHEFFHGTDPLWRVALPATHAPLDGENDPLVEWFGAQRWLRGLRDADTLRRQVRTLGGHLTRFRGAAAGPVFTPLSEPHAALQRRVIAAFDPDGVFDAGRLER